MGHFLMYSPIFCDPGSAQQGCWRADFMAESQVPRLQPSFAAPLPNSISLIWWELLTTNDTQLENQNYMCINIEQYKGSEH